MNDNRTSETQNAMRRESAVWLIVISALFVVFLFAAYYRLSGWARRAPTSIAKAPAVTVDLTRNADDDSKLLVPPLPDSISDRAASPFKLTGQPDANLNGSEQRAMLNESKSAFQGAPSASENSPPADSKFDTSLTNRTNDLPPFALPNPPIDSAMVQNAAGQPDKGSVVERSVLNDVFVPDALPESVPNDLIQSGYQENPLRSQSLGNSASIVNQEIAMSVVSDNMTDWNSSQEGDLPPDSGFDGSGSGRSSEFPFDLKQATRIPDSANPDTIDETVDENVVPAEFSHHPSDRNQESNSNSVVSLPTDTYWTIAQRVYDDGRLFRALHAVNKDLLGDDIRLEGGALVKTPSLKYLLQHYSTLIPEDIKRQVESTLNNSTELAKPPKRQ